MKNEQRAMSILPLILVSLGHLCSASASQHAQVPQNVDELWGDYDPRSEALQVDVVGEWKEADNTYRLIVYTVGTFKGTRVRMAAYYGFPQNPKKVPAVLHLHGGGQRAFLHEVEAYVKRGYACISINWGGKELVEHNPEGANTDWGRLNPGFVGEGHGEKFGLKPSPYTIDSFESPRNCDWYPRTIAARRAITFLERQPEVDADRIGVYGHSMGGVLTFYVAGTDARVKAAAPSVGGPGFLTFDEEYLPGSARRINGGDMELFRDTMGQQSYAPCVRCPILFLGATNDFNSRMNHVYVTYGRIPHEKKRYTFAPHLNHRFTDTAAICRPLWFEQYLKGHIVFPETPPAKLVLKQPDGVPLFTVAPDASREILAVDVYYSVDPDSIARFWRDAQPERRDGEWVAKLPVMDAEKPLYAFANVTYRLKSTERVAGAEGTDAFTISSLLHKAGPTALAEAGVRATDRFSALIDDFERGFHDWYVLAGDNRDHWVYSTRKLTDPKWRGPDDAALSIRVRSRESNELVLVLYENDWRGYRGPTRIYAVPVPLTGSDDWQDVVVARTDFQQVRAKEHHRITDGGKLSGWRDIDRLEIRAFYEVYADDEKTVIGSRQWNGPQPVLKELRWRVK